jgi:hypothetical protein
LKNRFHPSASQAALLGRLGALGWMLGAEHMHIDRVYVRAIQAAREIEIISAGHDLVELAGPNESGKSTTIDAVTYALCGAAGVNPDALRHGEEDGEVTVEMGDYTVTRKFSSRGKGRLTIRPSGKQRDLDALYSAFSFAPLDIATRRPGESAAAFRGRVVDALQKLAGPAFISALAMVDDEIAGAEETRRDAKRDLQRAGILQPVAKPAAPPEDTADIQVQLQVARNHNRRQREQSLKIDDRARRVGECERNVQNLRLEIQALQESLANAEAELAGFVAMDIAPPEPEHDEQAFVDRLSDVAAAQVAQSRWEDYQREMEKRAALARGANTAEGQVQTHRAARADLIAGADLPLPGITWDADGVYLDGTAWEQLSTGRRWCTAIDLAIAKQEQEGTRLRVLFIREGSLIDSKNFEAITETARAKGYQVWVESVSAHTDTAFEIEDGRVVNAPGAF